MKTAIAAIRSVIFITILWGIFTPLWCIPMLIFGRLIPLNKRFSIIVRPYAIVLIFLVKWICGVKYKVSGLENIPKNGGAIIVSNHQCAWETFYLQIPFKPQTQVIKKSLLSIPFFGWTFALQNPIAIDREAALTKVIKEGTARLKENFFVSIFPEGTRNKPDEVGEFSAGFVLLAKKGNAPVIPISLNPGNFWRYDSWLKFPGTITVTIHPPVEIKNSKTDLKNIEQLIRNGVEKANLTLI